MPYPKLSGILNNCALHAITPELKMQILRLSNDEDSVPALFKANYEILKSLFAEYYGLTSSTFSWKAFNQLLAPYNSFDFQILMGPVLRKFMELQIDHQRIREVESEAEYKKKMTSIQSHGRYQDMSPDDLFHLVAKHLGFQVAYLEQGLSELIYLDELDNQLDMIALYHEGGIEGAAAGGHWERTPAGEKREDNEGKSQLKHIISLFREGRELTTSYGIDLLKKYVLAQAQNNKPEIKRIILAAEQINLSITSLISNQKETIIEQFGSRICQETSHFLNGNPPQPSPPRLLKPNNPYSEILEQLTIFENKINTIGEHHPHAKNTAIYLHAQLLSLTQTTFNKSKVSKADIERYQSRVNEEIELARPVLQRDLGWGDYLSNLARNIGNILVKILSIGSLPSVFKPIKSEAIKAIEAFSIKK